MIIIRARGMLRDTELKAAAEDFREQAKTGVIVLPVMYELAMVTEDDNVAVVPAADNRPFLLYQAMMGGNVVKKEIKEDGLYVEVEPGDPEAFRRYREAYDDDKAEAGLTSED